MEKDLGLFIAGGKGKASRKTPQELESIGLFTGMNTTPHIYASRMSAKVDNAVLQDGYQHYHHMFFLCRDGAWQLSNRE